MKENYKVTFEKTQHIYNFIVDNNFYMVKFPNRQKNQNIHSPIYEFALDMLRERKYHSKLDIKVTSED